MKGIWKLALLAVAAGILAVGFVGGATSRVAHADPNSVIFKAYSGACSALPYPRPTPVTSVSPNMPYCVEWGTSGALAANETAVVAETGGTGGALTSYQCDYGIFGACTITNNGTASVTFSQTGGAGIGYAGLIDFTFTACSGGTLTLSTTNNSMTANLPLTCSSVGPAPYVAIIAVYPGTCADLTLPLPASVTTVVPGDDYCISTTAVPHKMGDTMTFTSTGVSGETFDLDECFTNSAGYDPCMHPGPGGSPYVINLTGEDPDSFVGANTDFTFSACTASTFGLTFSYDGPALMPASDSTTINCQAPAPDVNIIAVYPGTCADLTLPLPASVTTVMPNTDYCISSVASSMKTGDTMTFTSTGVGGENFNLRDCFTNSAGFDPCTHPGDGGSPYVIPLASEDPNSFVGLETDFSFTDCTAASLVLTFSYDGPALSPASDTETIDCNSTPVGFTKYTSMEDSTLNSGQTFTWYIDVPATSGDWTVTDHLPSGFKIAAKAQPDAMCTETIGGTSLTCSGTAHNSTITISVLVKATSSCGSYTNTAYLSGTGFTTQSASSTVRVICSRPGGFFPFRTR